MHKYSSAACIFLASCFSPGADIPKAGTSGSTTKAATSSTTTEQASTDTESSGETTMTTSTATTTSSTSGDQTTSSSTAPATCGDGMKGSDEECDDGPPADGDGCSALCTKEFRRVFVTSAVFTGALGGFAGADIKCQAAADSAAAPGTFRAWLSNDLASPTADFVHSKVPYVRLDDVQVAANWNDLVDGTLNAPISVSELGGPPMMAAHACVPEDALIAWTATNEAGLPLKTGACDNWSSTTGDATVGRVGDTSLAWSVFCPTPCSSTAALYCVEQ